MKIQTEGAVMKPATPKTEPPPSIQLRIAVFGGSPMINQLIKRRDTSVDVAVRLNQILCFLILSSSSIFASPQDKVSEGTAGVGAELKKGISVQVETADGKSLSNVTVVCVGPSTNAILKGITIEGGSERMQTDAEGRFSLPLDGTNLALVVSTDQGFGLAQSRDLTHKPTIVVQPWGRIEGVRTNRNHPLANARLYWEITWKCVGLEIEDRVATRERIITDSQGRFLFEHVPPTEIELWEDHKPSEKLSVRLHYLEVKPGETKHVELVTQGRTVVGRLGLGDGLLNSTVDLSSCFGGLGTDLKGQHLTMPELPKEFDTSEKRIKWWHDYWFNTEAGRLVNEVASRGRLFDIQSDGSFRTEMVAPGKYTVSGNIYQNKKRVAMVDQFSVVIPEVGADADDAPFDIGKVMLKPAVNLKIGDVAPDFSVKTLDDKPIKLSDFRGKYVLLDFWATWCGPCIAEMPNLKATYDTFGNDERLVMISLSLDSDREGPKRFVLTKGIAWTQVFLGDWSKDKVTPGYGVYAIPQVFLVGPNGKIVARGLRGPKIKEAVATALGSK